MELLLILRYAHGVAAYASIESLPFLLVRVESLAVSICSPCLHPSPPNLGGAMLDMVSVLRIPS